MAQNSPMPLPALTAEDLDTVDAEQFAEHANRLADPDPSAVEDVLKMLERSANPANSAESAWPPLLEEPRRRADSRYADPATSHRPWIGPVLVAAKRAFRAAFQPFINEVLRRQVEFNESLLGSLATIYEQVQVNARTQAMWRREVDARLREIERRLQSAPPPASPPRPTAATRGRKTS